MHDDPDELNDDERQRLREIEAELARDDPELAAVLGKSRLRLPIARLARRVSRRLGLIIGVLGGAVTLAVGLVLPVPLVGIVGFGLLVVALSRLLESESGLIVTRVRSMLGQSNSSGRGGGQSDTGEPGSG